MVANNPIGIFAKVSGPENGKVTYKQVNIPEGAPQRFVRVDQRNSDMFERLNTDIIMASGEAAKKQVRTGLWSAGILGTGTLIGTIAAFKKRRLLGVFLGLLAGAAGGLLGLFGGSFAANKFIMPKYAQRIQEDSMLINQMIEK